jgi:negative regulator of sigma E activity
MKRRVIYSLILTLLASSAFCKEATPADVLRKAAEADKHVDYRGMKTATIAFGHGTAVATMKVIHLRPDMTRTIYFTPDVLAGIVVIQDGSDLWRYRPKENVWEPVKCPPLSADVTREVLHNYDLKLTGTDRVAGRTAYVIQAVPRTQGDAAHRLWVDTDCYLIVGTQVESNSGAIVRSSRYVSLSVNPGDIPKSLFEVKGKIVAAPRPASADDFKVLKPSYLPTGYRLVGLSRIVVNGFFCAHSQFSNGGTTISLFQQKGSGPSPKTRVNSKVTNIIAWARDGMQFTLMGDISHAELQKIANSVK